MTHDVIIWCLIPFCAVLSFLLSGMEAGVFAVSRLRIRQQMRAGRRSARVLHGFLENPENFLWTIVVGNTLMNFVVLGWVFAALQGRKELSPAGVVVVFLAVVFLFYTFADLLPKMLFRTFPNRLGLALARPFRLLHLLLRPVVAVVEWCSAKLLRWTGGRAFTGHLFGNREELRLLMQESGGEFTSDERAMITRVLDFQSLTVRQITRSLEEVATVTSATPLAEVLAGCRARGVTRLPVWQAREGGRRVAGIINVDDVLFTATDEQRTVAEFLKPALFLTEDLRLEVALQRMQRGGQRLAVVLGRNGQEVGIVSLTDILKTIFGEVRL